MRKLTFGSLFAGIGGFDLGLERAGMECRWQVEIDDYAQRVLTKHWPAVPKYRDIRDIERGDLEPVDLICGGFPCQDISYAGKGAGIEGGRSGLWSEFARIIRLVRPRYVLVENVPALLNRGMGRVLGDLSACGYDAEWDCLPAAAVGAPHIRDRVWLFAHTTRKSRGVQGSSKNGGSFLFQPPTQQPDKKEWRENRELAPLVPGIHTGTSQDWWRAQSRVDRSVDGLSGDLDDVRRQRLKGGGNAIVPQVAEWLGRRILEA